MIQKVNINNIKGKNIKIIFLDNEKSNSSLFISDKITNIKPIKKTINLWKKNFGFLSLKKINIDATTPNKIIYVCLIDLLNISFKLFTDEFSEQWNKFGTVYFTLFPK